MIQSSHIELSVTALRNNIRFIRDRIGGEAVLYSVVKGNAYGHGIEQMIPLLQQAGVGHFAVFDAEEAYRVRQAAGGLCEIMIMGFIDDEDLHWAVENDVQVYVFDPGRLERIVREAKAQGKKAHVHIEVETGFNRTGFSEEGLKKALDMLRRHGDVVSFEGLCTHYAGAESLANYQRIDRQRTAFEKLAAMVRAVGPQPRHYHTACSAASIIYPSTVGDMTRIGILQYGFWPSEETYVHYLSKKHEHRNPLRRVISWKSRVMSVKSIGTGEYVGYGSTFMASMPTTIAVVPVGYGHGYGRSLSNLGRVLIRGIRLPVIGLVNMNMIVVNTNEAPGVEIGDEVVLIGSQGDSNITVASFSELSNQLNYELLTRLPATIPRRIVD